MAGSSGIIIITEYVKEMFETLLVNNKCAQLYCPKIRKILIKGKN